MASSKKPPRDLFAHVEHVLRRRVEARQHLLLGLSGGLDSVVLLDILARLRGALGFGLSALHVNHGLSPRAGEWADFCEDLCLARGVPLEVRSVTVDRGRGESIEAAARMARHAALAACPADLVVLAHHLDDQAETLLLQLLRGGGVAGARGMEERSGRLLRPLLEIPRSELERHAAARDLTWVEDESNVDMRFDRNFLRHRLLPFLEGRFPAYRETLFRASRNFAESALLQDELARLDGASALSGASLSVAALGRLSPPRARNLLRYHLRTQGALAPTAARLEDMLNQLLHARQDARVRISLGHLELRRFGGRAWVISPGPSPDRDVSYPWHGELDLALPQLGGMLGFREAPGQGISLERLRRDQVTVRIRRGGERLQTDCARPTRSLKNLFQEAGVPPWCRGGVPLVYSGDRLAAVVGIGVDCTFQAEPSETGIMLEWRT